MPSRTIFWGWALALFIGSSSLPGVAEAQWGFGYRKEVASLMVSTLAIEGSLLAAGGIVVWKTSQRNSDRRWLASSPWIGGANLIAGSFLVTVVVPSFQRGLPYPFSTSWVPMVIGLLQIGIGITDLLLFRRGLLRRLKLKTALVPWMAPASDGAIAGLTLVIGGSGGIR